MASAISLANRVARSDKGVSRGPQHRRLTGRLGNDEVTPENPQAVDPFADFLWPTPVTPEPLPPLFTEAHPPKYEYLKQELGRDLALLIDDVKEAGLYRPFFHRALTSTLAVCKCHPMRVTHLKDVRKWMSCDRERIARICQEMLDNVEELLRDIHDEVLPAVLATRLLKTWHCSRGCAEAGRWCTHAENVTITRLRRPGR